MAQTIITKRQQHTFPVDTILGDIHVITTHPATGHVTYTIGVHGPVVVPFVHNQVHHFTLPVNSHTLTISNSTTSGLSCTY